MIYTFIKEHRFEFKIRTMCRMLRVHPSGFYSWLREPFCKRDLENQRQTKLLKQVWNESGKVYEYRKLHEDLLDQGRLFVSTALQG